MSKAKIQQAGGPEDVQSAEAVAGRLMAAPGNLLAHFRTLRDDIGTFSQRMSTARRGLDSLDSRRAGLEQRREQARLAYYEAVDDADKTKADAAMSELASLKKELESVDADIAAAAGLVAEAQAEYAKLNADAVLLSQRSGDLMTDANQFGTAASGLLGALHGAASDLSNVQFRVERKREAGS